MERGAARIAAEPGGLFPAPGRGLGGQGSAFNGLAQAPFAHSSTRATLAVNPEAWFRDALMQDRVVYGFSNPLANTGSLIVA